GCAAVIDTIITEPTVLDANIAGNDPICFGETTGSTNITVFGGTPPYSYSWNTPRTPTKSSVDSLAAGTYNVIITDTNNCVINRSITLINPATVNTTITTIAAKCKNSCDGIAVATVSNGK